MSKKIGTFAPLSAIYSKTQSKEDNGMLSSGVIFLDWLKKHNQNAWQVLPLHETQFEVDSITKRMPSPYQSYGIGLSSRYLSSHYARMKPSRAELDTFISKQENWITDYALFEALVGNFKTADWSSWPADIRKREQGAVERWSEKLAESIDSSIITQWQLHREYQDFKRVAKENNISLIGDIPFYLSYRSPFVWAYQDLFLLEPDGQVRYSSGIPSTTESYFGRQMWGHPLYDWRETVNSQIIELWKIRIQYLSELYDTLRIDHAKGFYQYGLLDRDDQKNDIYRSGPGGSVLKELLQYSQTQGLTLFVEDNAKNVRDLRELINTLNIPGNKVFRWAYEEDRDRVNIEYADIAAYPTNTVAYSTTHDTATLLGFLQKLNESQKKRFISHTDIHYSSDNKLLARQIIKALEQSPANTVIIPIQDRLLIADQLNRPGTEKEKNDTNWSLNLPPIEDYIE